jgi:hypothetical protein
MCVIHRGFRGFRALSPASIIGSIVIGLKSAIPYKIINSTLPNIKRKIIESNDKKTICTYNF